MDYFQLNTMPNSDSSANWTLELPNNYLPNWPLMVPRRIRNWNEKIFAHYAHEAPYTDYPCVRGDWNICSPRLQEVFEKYAPDCIQFLPIRIRSTNGKGIVDGYAIANLLSVRDCLDREHSIADHNDWDPFNELGDIDLECTMLSKQRISDTRVFRVIGNSKLFVICQDVIDVIIQNGLTGCYFTKIECR
jgi:hypothetical protein